MSCINFNNLKITILFLTLSSFSISQDNQLTIELKNGNKISGNLLNETDSTYSLKTEFGQLEIPKEDISAVTDGSFNNKMKSSTQSPLLNSYFKKKNNQSPINQQARWRSIYATMAISNTLYGAGIPIFLILIRLLMNILVLGC